MQCTVFAHVVRQQDYANQFRYEILFSNRTVCNVKPIHRSARNFRFFDHHQSSNAVVFRIYKYKNNFKITWRGIENAKWKKKMGHRKIDANLWCEKVIFKLWWCAASHLFYILHLQWHRTLALASRSRWPYTWTSSHITHISIYMNLLFICILCWSWSSTGKWQNHNNLNKFNTDRPFHFAILCREILSTLSNRESRSCLRSVWFILFSISLFHHL